MKIEFMIRHVIVIMAAMALAIWSFYNLSGKIKLVAAVAFLLFAICYTIVALVTRKRSINLRALWKEFLDFLYGL